MPVFQAKQLEALITDVFIAAGTPSDIAQYVSSSLIDSSLKGVDSHGVMRVSKYVDEIMSGWIKPDARPEIERATPTMAIVRGNRGFGIFALGYAVDLAIRKAKAGQVAAIGLVDTTHTGRLGWYGEFAATQGVFMMIAGGGHSGSAQSGRWVAPHGGAQRMLSTNPYVFALPGGQFGPVVVDIATSAVGEGKLQVYRARQEPLPLGWILDKEGRPSTSVEDFYAGGMLLPTAGHKGYGLALVAELLGGALLGISYVMNWLIVVIDVAAFQPSADYKQATEEFLAKLKGTPPAQGFSEVMIPGEPETRTAEQRAQEGIPIPEQTWQKIQETARKVGIDPDVKLSNSKGYL